MVVKGFSRLLNPDWSIQISGAPAVCKGSLRSNVRHFSSRDCASREKQVTLILHCVWVPTKYYEKLPKVKDHIYEEWKKS